MTFPPQLIWNGCFFSFKKLYRFLIFFQVRLIQRPECFHLIRRSKEKRFWHAPRPPISTICLSRCLKDSYCSTTNPPNLQSDLEVNCSLLCQRSFCSALSSISRRPSFSPSCKTPRNHSSSPGQTTKRRRSARFSKAHQQTSFNVAIIEGKCHFLFHNETHLLNKNTVADPVQKWSTLYCRAGWNCFLKLLDLSHVSIWSRTHRKHL